VRERAVWLFEPDPQRRRTLWELFRAEFGVRDCADLQVVWKGLLGGQLGILVADVARLGWVGPADQRRVAALSRLLPVVLLNEGPKLVGLSYSDFGSANFVYEAFEDLERLRRSALALADSAAETLGSQSPASF